MKPRVTDGVFAGIVVECLSVAQVLVRLKLVPAGGNYKTVKDRISGQGLVIAHFTGKVWNQGGRYRNFGKQYSLTKILVADSPYACTHSLRGRLLKEGTKIIDVSRVDCVNGWLNQFPWRHATSRRKQ